MTTIAQILQDSRERGIPDDHPSNLLVADIHSADISLVDADANLAIVKYLKKKDDLKRAIESIPEITQPTEPEPTTDESE